MLQNPGSYKRTTNQVISDVIKVKNAYIEYDFSKYLNIILFFLKQDSVEHRYTNYLVENIANNINFLYYKNDPIRRILKESGIYESDIDTVYEYVKDCGEDINQIRAALKNVAYQLKDRISFLSRYSIDRM